MQLDAAVVRSRKATAAQAAGGHPEVAAVFLYHDVRRHLRCAENGVLTLVNAEGFPDAIRVGRIGIVPSLVEFHEWNLVGRVAINLVRAHVDEWGYCLAFDGDDDGVTHRDRRHGSCWKMADSRWKIVPLLPVSLFQL